MLQKMSVKWILEVGPMIHLLRIERAPVAQFLLLEL
jgi:hypothetical protein